MAIKSLFKSTSPGVAVTLSEDLLFVHPTLSEVHDTTPGISRDPILFGTALLSLPTQKAVSKIRVVFEGLTDASAGSGHPYETTEALRKELELDLKGEIVESGDHAFNFSFIVPSNAAPYQRCNYGRTRYSVKATVIFASTLKASISSAPIAVYVTASPQGPNEVPLPADISLQHFDEALGPVGVGFASPHLTVASLISVRLSLLGAPTKLNIISIKCFVSQHFTIHYIDGKVVRPPPARYDLRAVDPSSAPSLCVPVSQMGRNMPLPPLKSNKYPRPLPPPADLPLIDPEPLAEVEKGEPYSFSRVMRIPIDDHVRATTLDGSETPIRVSHKLLVEVRYRAEAEAGDKIFLFGKDVTIGSCCSLADSVWLPAYSSPSPKLILQPLPTSCCCTIDTKDLFDRDGVALRRAASIDEPSSEARVLGQEKSPAFVDAASLAMPSPTPHSTDLFA